MNIPINSVCNTAYMAMIKKQDNSVDISVCAQHMQHNKTCTWNLVHVKNKQKNGINISNNKQQKKKDWFMRTKPMTKHAWVNYASVRAK